MYTKCGGTASKRRYLQTIIAADNIFHPVYHFCRAKNLKLRAKCLQGSKPIANHVLLAFPLSWLSCKDTLWRKTPLSIKEIVLGKAEGACLCVDLNLISFSPPAHRKEIWLNMKKAYSERSFLLQREFRGIVPLNTHGSGLYVLNLRYSLLLASTTPVIFKRLHLKCNLIICQIATKTFPSAAQGWEGGGGAVGNLGGETKEGGLKKLISIWA